MFARPCRDKGTPGGLWSNGSWYVLPYLTLVYIQLDTCGGSALPGAHPLSKFFLAVREKVKDFSWDIWTLIVSSWQYFPCQRNTLWGSKFCFSTPTKGGTCLFPFILASLVQEEFTFHFLMPALWWYNNGISFILKSLKYFHIHYFQLFMQIISVAPAMIYFNIVF